MATVSSPDASPAAARTALRRACQDLSERGLLAASRWAAELLCALPSQPAASTSSHSSFVTSTPNRPRSSMPGFPPELSLNLQEPPSPFGASQAELSSFALSPDQHRRPLPRPPPAKDPHRDSEEDVYTLGKAYFDTREYARAAHTLRDCQSVRNRFLALYARYLVGEKRTQEEHPIMSPKDRMRKAEPESIELLKELKGVSDPFLLYLKGLVLGKLGKRFEAVNSFVQSVVAYPYNWSCWLEIATLIERSDELSLLEVHFPNSFMSRIFHVHAVLEVHSATETLLDQVEELLKVFPTSMHLKSQKAMVSYHLREFDDAEAIFDEIFEADPYRLDDIDTYSNILYVMEKRPKLSQMAHKYTQLDKHRPETCCLVGNYYSARGDHEKAIMYFRRALKLDRGYLSAWTLMGHEYVELKNSHAAVEAYRRAVDVNPKDYRAWYGLGQTYDILDMPLYSLGYFQRAVGLRPYDGRMWAALGACYEKHNNFEEALKCYKRALLNSESGDVGIFTKITRACDMTGQPKLAAAYHKAAVDMSRSENLELGVYAKHCIAFVKWLLGVSGDGGRGSDELEMARKYATMCMDTSFEGPEKDQAKELLSKVEVLQMEMDAM